MRSTRILVAVALLVTLGAILALGTAQVPRAPSTAPAPASAGTSRPLWVWTYDPETSTPFLPTYRALLEALPLDGRILVAVAQPEDAILFCDALGRDGADDARITYVAVGARVTPWARDRLIAVEDGPVTRFLTPPSRRVRDVAQGDLRLARLLARQAPIGRVVECTAIVEGGDVLLAADTVFVGGQTLTTATGGTDERSVPFLESLHRAFGRHPFVVHDGAGRVPHPHIDMFMTVVHGNTVVLGDPRLALEGWPHPAGHPVEVASLDGLGAYSHRHQLEMAAIYDGIALLLRGHGFELVRIPILHGEDPPGPAGSVTLTWNNVLLDEHPDRREVWIPDYGLGDLETRAREAWEGLGFTVHPVAAREPIRMGGALRCLTNVVPDALPETLSEPFFTTPCSVQ